MRLPRLDTKVVETSIVSEESLQGRINEWVSRGRSLEHIRFVVREGSHGPAVVFVLFTRAHRFFREGGQEA